VSGFVVGIGETPRLRHPDASLTTAMLMRDALQLALRDADLGLQDIDGLAVASFSLEPDRAIDFAWRTGLTVRWLMQDTNGGAAGLNMMSHAVSAIQAGAASNIAVVAGDISTPQSFRTRANNYHSATRDHLAPLGFGGPSASFAMLTKRQMRKFGLASEDYGHLAISQRQAAMGNPLAAYRTPLTMDHYLNAPVVADPLRRFDCVPIVAGASAMILSGEPRTQGETPRPVRILAFRQSFNPDHQDGDGLTTGIRQMAQDLWNAAGVSASEMDVTSVYDDFPAMAYAQLADLGFIAGDDIARFARERIAARRFAVNTGGGLLSAGQAGCAAGLQGIVEVARQLQHRGGDRQVPGARLGVASAYGMVLYRYCACSGAVVLARQESQA
jgi:acetyl-CoA acetyltransferase